MVIQNVDGLFFRMRAPTDMSFLRRFGRVFKVFDDQDSGNICFGVTDGGRRYFVKLAGLQTAEYEGTPQDAVERLKAAVPAYDALRHENLVNLISAEEIGGGFAAVFEWTDAVCMGRQYPDSHRWFMSMPVDKRKHVFDDILAFHLHVAEAGWVAIDFYDGSIMYDFDRGQTVICDIDSYRKHPVTNEMGRMWGSSHFMSPEEFVAGAHIDEITNVFLMGATAFMLLGGGLDRSTVTWTADPRLHEIALKAVNKNRGDRFRTLAEFEAAWKRATAG